MFLDILLIELDQFEERERECLNHLDCQSVILCNSMKH